MQIRTDTLLAEVVLRSLKKFENQHLALLVCDRVAFVLHKVEPQVLAHAIKTQCPVSHKQIYKD